MRIKHLLLFVLMLRMPIGNTQEFADIKNQKNDISSYSEGNKYPFSSTFSTIIVDGQPFDSLRFDFKNTCEKNFSTKKIDSSYCNFYMLDFNDTVYFRSASCIIQPQTTSPVTFKYRIQNGYANGFMRMHLQADNSFTSIDGRFSEGIISTGSHLDYFLNGTLKTSGQYEFGQRSGVWTWYFESGKINRIIIYENSDPLREIEFDKEGNVVAEYDFVKEKTNAKKR